MQQLQKIYGGYVDQMISTSKPRENGRHFADERHFRTDFLLWSIIDSDNGLGRICLKTFIRTKDGMIYWGMYMSLGVDDLTVYSTHMHFVHFV